MILKYYFWGFKKAFTPEQCEKFIKFGLSKPNAKQALVGQEELDPTIGSPRGYDMKKPLNKKQLAFLKKKRISKTIFMQGEDLYKLLQPYLRMANKNAGWNFEVDWSEPVQFAHYSKGHFYGWHRDGWVKPYPIDSKPCHPNWVGKIRKLSMTVQLSDPKTYDGGELELDARDWDHTTPSKKPKPFVTNTQSGLNQQGSVIVFPSFLWHRVRPVTQGTRYSLVMWTLGRPYV